MEDRPIDPPDIGRSEFIEAFVLIYDDHYSRQYGFWRPYVQQMIYRYLDYGDIYNGFVRVKYKACILLQRVLFSTGNLQCSSRIHSEDS